MGRQAYDTEEAQHYMVIVNLEACKGCMICQKNCPLDAVHVVERKAVVDADKCCECGCAPACVNSAPSPSPLR